MDHFRLSPVQRRLWALARGGHRFWAQTSVRWDGPMEPACFRAALADASTTFEALRTTIQTPPGMQQPLQCIADVHKALVALLDLSALSESARTRVLACVSRLDGLDGLDAASGPLLGVIVCRITPMLWQITLMTPAVCADAWSLAVVAEHVRRRVACDPIDETPVQYVDAAEVFNTRMASPEGQAAMARWRRPLFRHAVRRDVPSSPIVMVREELTLEAAVAARLDQVAASHVISIEMIILAAWMVQQARVEAEDHVAVGYTWSRRDDPELADAVGPYAQVLPLVERVNLDASLVSLARTLSASVEDMKAAADGFDWAAFEAHLGSADRGVYLTRAFEAYGPLRPLAGGALSRVRLAGDTDRWELKLRTTVDERGIDCAILGTVPRWSQQRVSRTAWQIRALLESVIKGPDVPAGDLDMCTSEELRTLERWSQSAHDRVSRV